MSTLHSLAPQLLLFNIIYNRGSKGGIVGSQESLAFLLPFSYPSYYNTLQIPEFNLFRENFIK